MSISKLVAAAILTTLSVGVPASAQAADAPTQSCQNAKAAVAHAKAKKANAKRDVALAKAALKRAEHAHPAKVEHAEAKLARALERKATRTVELREANVQMRHNCTTPSPVTPVTPTA